jgi:beta-ureidopropionase / N-carbamoyl-L-amino-acid hydrolase
VSIAERLAGLDSIGHREDGIWRLAWTAEDAACREWFEHQAGDTGLAVERDPAGNLWACPASDPPWWAIGSHLDSVRGGGRFDGPLGVACGFEIAASGEAPLAVIAFEDEEGARFNTPTFGSKALAGRLDVPAVLERRDDDGVTIAEAMRAAGVDPEHIGDAPRCLERLAGFIEVHIDQTRDLARAAVPVGIVSALANRVRLEVGLDGRADHAGTTPREERQDALSAAARAIVAAEDLGAGHPELTVTASRIIAEPNAPTTIASHVRLWIDARSPDPRAIDAWLGELSDELRSGPVPTTIAIASRSSGQAFDPELRRTLAGVGAELIGKPVPEVVCLAGHDAGVLAAKLPAAMVFVRNATGVSHSPAEDVDLHDADVAVELVRRALRSLA